MAWPPHCACDTGVLGKHGGPTLAVQTRRPRHALQLPQEGHTLDVVASFFLSRVSPCLLCSLLQDRCKVQVGQCSGCLCWPSADAPVPAPGGGRGSGCGECDTWRPEVQVTSKSAFPTRPPRRSHSANRGVGVTGSCLQCGQGKGQREWTFIYPYAGFPPWAQCWGPKHKSSSQVGGQIYQEITARLIMETLPSAMETLWKANGHSLPGK